MTSVKKSLMSFAVFALLPLIIKKKINQDRQTNVSLSLGEEQTDKTSLGDCNTEEVRAKKHDFTRLKC